MSKPKKYYSLCTCNEKIWINADTSELSAGGCLAFYNIEDGFKTLVAAFPISYWRYVYEADINTGESLQDQIPFWKKHNKSDDWADTSFKNKPQRQRYNHPD